MSGAVRHLRWLAPLSTLVVSAAFAYVWAEDSWNERERVLREHINLRAEIEAKQGRAVNLDAYRARLKDVRALYEDVARLLPSEPVEPNLWAALAAESSGILLINVDQQAEHSREFYASSDASVRLEGGFSQFLDFVDSLAHVSPTCSPETPRCGGPSHAISRVAMRQRAPGILRIDLDVTLYRYLDEEEVP